MWLSDELAFFSSVCSFVPYYLCLLLSILIFISPIDPTKAAQDFTAYRLTQFDLQDSVIGSRIAALSCDIQAVSTKPYARRCIVVKLAELTFEGIKIAVTNNVGGIIVILPSNSWSSDLRLHWHDLETQLISEDFQIPIYFTTEDEELENVYTNLQKISLEVEKSASSGVLDAIFSTGYRVYAAPPLASPLKNMELINIEGRISPLSFDSKKPTILLTAYYDSSGVIPSLSYGADANAGGVTVLLEVARILSQLNDARNIPKYNVIFLLTGGGKLNFLGSKRWLEKNLEDTAGLAMLDSIVQVLCLEGLGTNMDDQLHLHVSRVPKEGTFSQKLVSALEVASSLHPLWDSVARSSVSANLSQIEVVHKKINLNQYDLAWEHERFSLHRLATATLSAWPSATSYRYRHSVLDGGPLYGPVDTPDRRENWGPVNPELVARNARVLAEALSRVLYEVNPIVPAVQSHPLIDPLWSTKTTASALMDLLTMRPRAFQLLSVPPRSGIVPTSGPDLIQSLEKYAQSILPEVRLIRHPLTHAGTAGTGQTGTSSSASGSAESGADTTGADPSLIDEANSVSAAVPSMSAAAKEVEITFYSSVSPQTVTVYRLKSSIFDLVVACVIAAYLYVLYLVFEHFHVLVWTISCLMNARGKKMKTY